MLVQQCAERAYAQQRSASTRRNLVITSLNCCAGESRRCRCAQRARSAFLVMNLLALIGYAAFPLMPPRLLNDCDTHFGGCQQGFHFVDTMDVYGGLWSWRNSSIAKVNILDPPGPSPALSPVPHGTRCSRCSSPMLILTVTRRSPITSQRCPPCTSATASGSPSRSCSSSA